MFTRLESLLEDIDLLALHQDDGREAASFSAERFRTEVGQGLVMLATGRMPPACQVIGSDTTVSELRQQTARLVISRVFLGHDSNLYLVLGAAPDCPSEILRENYRRLMGLVHPDTRPVGFPEDSASRVNFAYSVVSDEERRAAYDASLALVKQQSAFPPQAVVEAASPRQARPLREQSLIDRMRATVPQLRFANGLLAIAALILVPTGIAFFSITERDGHPQIVEVRPKLNMTPQVASMPEKSGNNSADTASPRISSSSNSTAIAPIAIAARTPTPTPTTSSSGPIRLLPVPQISALQPLTLSSDLARKPPAIVAASPPPRQPDALPVASALSISESTTSVQSEITASPKPIARNGTPLVPAAASNALPSLAPVASATSTNVDTSTREASIDGIANAPVVRSASISSAAAVSTVPTESRVNPGDASDVLVTLSSAYESGSIAAFSKVLASTMPGRRQVLSDYERVFQQTRQRSIRFTDFRNKAIGERLVTSGYAVVSTVDNDNRVSNHRIFLEIDISRTPAGLKIERLHNFPLN